MKVGYSPVLKIDPDFKSLMHPLSEKEFLSLRENILDGGTTYSIAAWNEYLIDGYERYMIFLHFAHWTEIVAFVRRSANISLPPHHGQLR